MFFFPFTANKETVHSSNSVKRSAPFLSSDQCSDHPVRCTSIPSYMWALHCSPLPAWPSQSTIDHHTPRGHRGEGGGEEGRKRRWAWMVGWNCLEITADPLGQVENTTRISGAFRMHGCSQWRDTFTFTLFISVSKIFLSMELWVSVWYQLAPGVLRLW